jgi:hypothetical protein
MFHQSHSQENASTLPGMSRPCWAITGGTGQVAVLTKLYGILKRPQEATISELDHKKSCILLHVLDPLVSQALRVDAQRPPAACMAGGRCAGSRALRVVHTHESRLDASCSHPPSLLRKLWHSCFSMGSLCHLKSLPEVMAMALSDDTSSLGKPQIFHWRT